MSNSDIKPLSESGFGESALPHETVVVPTSTGSATRTGRQYSQSIPEHAIRSQETFLVELPELLRTHRGGAAAYQDGQRIGLAPSRRELFWQLVQAGHDPSRFFVFAIAEAESSEVEILFDP